MLTPLFFFVLRRTVITLEKLSRRVLTTTSKGTVNQELKEIKIKKKSQIRSCTKLVRMVKILRCRRTEALA